MLCGSRCMVGQSNFLLANPRTGKHFRVEQLQTAFREFPSRLFAASQSDTVRVNLRSTDSCFIPKKFPELSLVLFAVCRLNQCSRQCVARVTASDTLSERERVREHSEQGDQSRTCVMLCCEGWMMNVQYPCLSRRSKCMAVQAATSLARFMPTKAR